MSGPGGISSWPSDRSPPSGGGTGGGAGNGGGGGGGPDECDITTVTNLNSPVPAVVTTLRVGDVLAVRLQVGPPRVLVAETSAGQVAGSLTPREMPRIIQCIQGAAAFEAEVLALRGGVCQVRVRRA